MGVKLRAAAGEMRQKTHKTSNDWRGTDVHVVLIPSSLAGLVDWMAVLLTAAVMLPWRQACIQARKPTAAVTASVA